MTPDPQTLVRQCGAVWSRGQTQLLDTVLSALNGAPLDLVLTSLAIITVESDWQNGVTSDRGAVGLMQLKELAITDAIAQCNMGSQAANLTPEVVRTNPAANVLLGTCYYLYALEKAGGNTAAALTIYNGGFKQLARLEKGLKLAPETGSYVTRVLFLIESCARGHVKELKL